MTHIVHKALPDKRGYYSKVEQSRTIVQTSEITMWDQVIPAGGYITPHLHHCDETLTFLSGEVEVTLAEDKVVVRADETVLIPAGTLHSVINNRSEPARLLAVLVTGEPRVIYPDGLPDPVDWGEG